MTKPKKLHQELEDWANIWYEYSLNDPEAKMQDEMNDLKKIINKVKLLEDNK